MYRRCSLHLRPSLVCVPGAQCALRIMLGPSPASTRYLPMNASRLWVKPSLWGCFRFGCLQCTSWCTHTMAWARRTALDQHGNSFGFCNQICRLHGLVSFEIVQARIPQLDGMRSEFQAIHGFTDRSWNAPVRSAVPGLSLHHDGDGNSDTFCNQSLTDLNSNPLPCQHGPNRPRGFWLYNSAAGPSVSFYYKFALRTRWS